MALPCETCTTVGCERIGEALRHPNPLARDAGVLAERILDLAGTGRPGPQREEAPVDPNAYCCNPNANAAVAIASAAVRVCNSPENLTLLGE